ncbi:hypothetical protein MKHDV_02622 [Halodesulfovibrio sp. MK-HDV]|nr:hypothetical protein MKHDV_02622 [Halodesulfovibrio sp. MK-HDV]
MCPQNVPPNGAGCNEIAWWHREFFGSKKACMEDHTGFLFLCRQCVSWRYVTSWRTAFSTSSFTQKALRPSFLGSGNFPAFT